MCGVCSSNSLGADIYGGHCMLAAATAAVNPAVSLGGMISDAAPVSAATTSARTCGYLGGGSGV